MTNEVKCPECGKAIGAYIPNGVHGLSNLGAVAMYDTKLDHRKAARVGLGKGTLCKGCAKGYVPAGIAYKVTVNNHGARITPYVGIKHCGLFADKKEAEAMAKEMDRRCPMNLARVEELRI